jgi:hypothetical protein
VLLAIGGGICFVCCGGGVAGLTSIGRKPDVAPADPKPAAALPQAKAENVATVSSPSIEPTTELASQISPTPEEPQTIEPSTFGHEFTDSTGEYHTRAEFVDFHQATGSQPSTVTLRKKDGTFKDVPMNSLSKDDQEWIRAEVKRRKGP